MVNGENYSDVNNQKKAKKLNLFLVVGVPLAVVIICLVVFFIIFNPFIRNSTYNNLIGDYFHALVNNDTNAIFNLTSSNFVNELSFISIPKKNYTLFSYNTETVSENNENNIIAVVLFSLNINQLNNQSSYLCNAEIGKENGKIKIFSIRKKYFGVNITK